MTKSHRIKVIGKPKAQINIDLLAQAILAMTEQQLQREGDTPTLNSTNGDEQ